MPEASSFIVLNLRSPVTFNIFTNEHWRPGEKYQESQTPQQYFFVVSSSSHAQAVRTFALLFRTLHNHPDWSQLHSFFSKRYRSADPRDRSARKLSAPEDRHYKPKPVTVGFLTSPEAVGLPGDWHKRIVEGYEAAKGKLMGPDPINCSLGPAIGMAVGGGAWMDLLYGGNPPGAYVPVPNAASSVVHTRKGGRGRTLAEWKELWMVIADWVYEYDASSIQHGFLSWHTYKYKLTDAEMAECRGGDKIPRKYLKTNGIAGADGIRDFFEQLAEDPARFHGLEWDFLKIQAEEGVEKAFYARFGSPPEATRRIEELTGKDVGLERGFGSLSYGDVPPLNLKRCPPTFRGQDWEKWMLSVEGGDVVAVKTIFQALWAVILLSQLPFHIKIMEKEGRFPRFRDPDSVYI